MSGKNSNHLSQCKGSRAPKQSIQDARRRKEGRSSLRYYAELMKHDAHCKIGGRIRQQRWGKQ